MVSIRTLLLEYVDNNGAAHIRELHIEVQRERPGTPEHTIRARLSEAVADGLLNRVGDGFYDVYAEDEGMTSVVSYPSRCSLWGDSRYRGNCDGRLFKNLVLQYGARRDPTVGSGTTRDVVAGLNRYKRAGIEFWGGDLREGFDLTRQELPGGFDFVWIHPPYWNIVRYSETPSDLSNVGDYEQFHDLLMTCLKRPLMIRLAGKRPVRAEALPERDGQKHPACLMQPADGGFIRRRICRVDITGSAVRQWGRSGFGSAIGLRSVPVEGTQADCDDVSDQTDFAPGYHTELRRFVLHPQRRDFPPKYRCYTYFNPKGTSRLSGMGVALNVKTGIRFLVVAEISFFPMGYCLMGADSDGEQVAQKLQLCDLTPFSRCELNERRHLWLRIPRLDPVGPAPLAFQGKQ